MEPKLSSDEFQRAIEAIRMSFSLSVEDAAAVFHVSRPTIYEYWRPNVRMLTQAERDRVILLKAAAAVWDGHQVLKGRWLKQPLKDGDTLFERLCANSISAEILNTTHQELFDMQDRLITEERGRTIAFAHALREGFMKASKSSRRSKAA